MEHGEIGVTQRAERSDAAESRAGQSGPGRKFSGCRRSPGERLGYERSTQKAPVPPGYRPRGRLGWNYRHRRHPPQVHLRRPMPPLRLLLVSAKTRWLLLPLVKTPTRAKTSSNTESKAEEEPAPTTSPEDRELSSEERHAADEDHDSSREMFWR